MPEILKAATPIHRRALLGGMLILPAAMYTGQSARATSAPARIGTDFTTVTLTYRGIHFGTHSPVFYERRTTVTNHGHKWHEVATEIHDGDVLTGPNALPRIRHENSIDTLRAIPTLESMTVAEKPVAWTYRYDRDSGRVDGFTQFGSAPMLVDSPVDGNAYAGDALFLVLAAQPLHEDFRVDHQLLSFGGETIQKMPVKIHVKRQQFARISDTDVPVFRIEVTSDQPHVAGTGTYLALVEPPHWIVRAEYQSTHMAGPPEFDSRGADVLTSVHTI